MILKACLCKLLPALVLTIAIFTTECLGKAKLNQQQLHDGEEAGPNSSAISTDENKFRVPFVVLMSNHEICVAQLPLIDYGNVSVVYRSLVDDHDWSESASKIADVRDSEQMPKSSLSLGKSERQQIAAGQQYSSNEREEVGKRRSEDALARSSGEGGKKVEEGPARTLPRKKRSSSNSGNSLLQATNDGTVNNNDRDASNRGVAVQESSSIAMNVTSARSWNEQEEVVRRSRTEDDDDEPENGAVQFSDFDVHMRLGIAFVADTRGRVHRFKLSGYGNGNSRPYENDYTNSISSSLSHFESQAANERSSAYSGADDGRTFGLHNFSSYRGGDDDGLSLTDSDAANKAELFHAAGERFGRHPTTSGLEQGAKLDFVESMKDHGASPSNTLVGPNHDKRSRAIINSARPRIIWSRTKHGIPAYHAASGEATAAQTAQRGALSPIRFNSSPKSSYNDQMANDSEQLEGDRESEDSPSDQHLTSVNVSSGADSQSAGRTSEPGYSRQRSNGADEPRTEVAVDWLNNLLFVLDKYRLLVLDYEGNYELTLIDDFNSQPVNLKADPVNGFLFWLQVGKFHNTIYKLDLNILERHHNGSSQSSPLISHHYAHPIVTNLPTHARIFIIDQKHSRIYVPLTSSSKNNSDVHQPQSIGDTEIFSVPSDESNLITHMNSTSTISSDVSTDAYNEKSLNISETNCIVDGQILAYNLDGTDVGPLRPDKRSGHSYNFDDISDITLDTSKSLLYWLTNSGKDIFEEYQGINDTLYQAQHNLGGGKFKKIIHFNIDANQPLNKPRFNLRKLFTNLASTTAANRWARSDRLNSNDQGLASSLNGFVSSDYSLMGFSRFAVIILGGIIIASLFGIFVYFVSRPTDDSNNHNDHHNSNSSSAGSFIGESQVDSVAHTNGFVGTSTISRWIPRPSTSSVDTSTFHRNVSKDEAHDSCDFESSTNYGRSNAIDEHYRDSVYDQALIQMEKNCLTNLARWPSNMCEVSNKLYVPIELQEDETLSSIHRVSIGQLNIEKRAPLGEGHFGTVLQGTITCTLYEKGIMMSRSSARNAAVGLAALSSGSSGHGSSTISSEFTTANSVADVINGDYLLPKSNADSATSDYSNDGSHVAGTENGISNPSYHDHADLKRETKFKVAIKKLKENASPKERSDFLQEAKHLAKFDHPNIVSLIGICLDRGSTLIIMELMLGGDLIRYMQENKPTSDNQDKLTPDDLLSICLDIVNACCYLEEREHIHRDLAARNCLVSSRKKDERVVKLADFGLARDIYKDSYYKKLNDSAMPLKWMAPECLMEQKFTIKSDVWSFGVVMWEVMSFCQDKPYNNVEHFMMKDHLIEGLRLGRPDHCCEDVYRLMNECWQLDPNRRPTFEECRATLIEIKSGSH